MNEFSTDDILQEEIHFKIFYLLTVCKIPFQSLRILSFQRAHRATFISYELHKDTVRWILQHPKYTHFSKQTHILFSILKIKSKFKILICDIYCIRINDSHIGVCLFQNIFSI